MKRKGANPRSINPIRFLVLSGFREQEALTLRWDAIDFTRGVATLGDSKSGRSQRLLGAPALALLAELPREEGNPYVFPAKRARSHLEEILQIEGLRDTYIVCESASTKR